MDSEENNDFDMINRFLPSFDIRSLKTSPNSTAIFKAENPEIDIFSDKDSGDEDNFALDIKKLEDYIVFVVSVRYRKDGKNVFQKSGFKNCEIADFERVGYHIEDYERQIYESRFCPNLTGEISKWFRVKNGYTNYRERISFAVEVIKCSKDQNPNCKSEEEIGKVLDLMYFTFYYIEEKI